MRGSCCGCDLPMLSVGAPQPARHRRVEATARAGFAELSPKSAANRAHSRGDSWRVRSYSLHTEMFNRAGVENAGPVQEMEMEPVLSSQRYETRPPAASVPQRADGIIEARLWIEEYAWLHGILKSDANVCPTFRFPDLISAAVSLSLARPDGHEDIFRFLGTQLVLRPPSTARRRESMWRAQYEQLRGLQRSPANRHPNPNFQLDQLTTACVAQAPPPAATQELDPFSPPPAGRPPAWRANPPPACAAASWPPTPDLVRPCRSRAATHPGTRAGIHGTSHATTSVHPPLCAHHP